jgi:hypothetical protein
MDTSIIRSRNHHPSSLTAAMNKQHTFSTVTFTRPSYCDICNNFIWGVVKQGLSCFDCGLNTHRKCCSLVASPCIPPQRTASFPVNTNPASARELAQEETRRDLVTELFAETQVQSKKLGNALNDSNPALSMTLFIKNNQRYTNRQYPFIWVNETVIKLLTWDSVPNTLIFLLSYIILCICLSFTLGLKPILLAILPQLVILYLMAKFYHKRADSIMNGSPLPRPHVIGQAPRITLTFAENKLALQNIQNTMGHISDLYDAGYNVYRMVDWSNPDLTKDVLIKVVASMFGTIALVSLVPINSIAMFAGVGVFVTNTALFKAASLTIAPVLVKSIQKRVEHVSSLIRDARKQGKDPVIDIVIFENQRWWAGTILLVFNVRSWLGLCTLFWRAKGMV